MQLAHPWQKFKNSATIEIGLLYLQPFTNSQTSFFLNQRPPKCCQLLHVTPTLTKGYHLPKKQKTKQNKTK
jgi:hypothetical protein